MLKLLNYSAVLAVWIISTVEADCNTKHQESPAFGTNCAYRCHCLNNVQCHTVTGECPDGCEIGWMGPACQYRNLVPGYLGMVMNGRTKMISDNAKYAVDRNRSTCCKTDPASGAGQQFWRIEMKRAYIISGLKIVIKQEDVENFRGFRIECGFSDTNFRHICYEHPNIPGSVDMEVSCNKPVFANHLRIILRLENVTLSLCEVEIYGGREIAFNRPTNGTRQYNEWSPNQAVDGKFLTDPYGAGDSARRSTCYAGVYRQPPPENPWWTVDLGTVFEIEDVYYYGREDGYRTKQMDGFFVLLSNGSDGPYTRLYNDTVSDTFYLPKEAKLRSVASGQIVRVERAIPQDTLTICELMVFGECPANACGLNCATHCHCASEYITGSDKIYGTCPRGCAGRWTGAAKRCDTECTEDKWGTACQNECGHCSTSPCDVRNGSCPTGCLDDLWQPPYCTECSDGRYGQNCSKVCGLCLNNTVCNKTTGQCKQGCVPGLQYPLCQKDCDTGTYGHNCSEKCGQCTSPSQCNTTTGYCMNACKPGFIGVRCKEECPISSFGQNCTSKCGKCAKNSTCNKVNGMCERGCKSGYQGLQCSEPCPFNKYGDNCTETCGHCANTETCDHIIGHCQICELGYHWPKCVDTCSNNTHGLNCSLACGYCNGDVACDTTTGRCPTGCKNGFTGEFCALAVVDPEGVLIPGVAGGVSGFLVVLIIIIAIILITKKRNSRKDSEHQMKSVGHPTNSISGKPSTHEYVNVAAFNTNINASHQKLTVAREPSTPYPTEEYEESEATYGNIQATKEFRSVAVTDIRTQFTSDLKNPDKLTSEFVALPRGLIYPHSAALKPNNKSKNRYKNMYPYDATRVKLPHLQGIPDSDYINANYISGYSVSPKYIASQGPIKDTLVDTWRMIWSEKIAVIVMLTDLIEMGKMKCIQYWFDDAGVFGDHEIRLMETETYANFVVRRLQCKKLSTKEIRTVLQFHFTAWPDKDVPETPLALVEFWKKVRQSQEAATFPWMVHCSAGIGRTGTFIALDYLSDQGLAEQTISVNNAVAVLREQRLTMVQTKEQYHYLHAIVMEALDPIGEVCPTQQYTDVYSSLYGNSGDKIGDEFKRIERDTAAAICIHSDEIANQKTSPDGLKPENVHKSRDQNIIPDDMFRPRLLTERDGQSDFINAVFVPTFRKDRQVIMTQVPLPDTVVDFVCMLWDFEVKTVVLLDKIIPENEIYWPAMGDPVRVGPFQGYLLSETADQACACKTIRFTCDNSSGTRDVCLYQFTAWSDELPEVDAALSLLTAIQNNDTNTPIAFQCGNGATRSGLFTVLWCLMDRLKTDHEVAIAETLRLVRTRRQQTIKNITQYRFCHDVIRTYLDTFELYANT